MNSAWSRPDWRMMDLSVPFRTSLCKGTGTVWLAPLASMPLHHSMTAECADMDETCGREDGTNLLA